MHCESLKNSLAFLSKLRLDVKCDIIHVHLVLLLTCQRERVGRTLSHPHVSLSDLYLSPFSAFLPVPLAYLFFWLWTVLRKNEFFSR